MEAVWRIGLATCGSLCRSPMLPGQDTGHGHPGGKRRGHHATRPACRDRRRTWVCRESGSPEPSKFRLLDHAHKANGTQHDRLGTDRQKLLMGGVKETTCASLCVVFCVVLCRPHAQEAI